MCNAWKSLSTEEAESPGPLGNVRILDLSGVVLSDFGADVIRVAAVSGALGKPKITTGSRFEPSGAVDQARGGAFDALHRNQWSKQQSRASSRILVTESRRDVGDLLVTLERR